MTSFSSPHRLHGPLARTKPLEPASSRLSWPVCCRTESSSRAAMQSSQIGWGDRRSMSRRTCSSTVMTPRFCPRFGDGSTEMRAGRADPDASERSPKRVATRSRRSEPLPSRGQPRQPCVRAPRLPDFRPNRTPMLGRQAVELRHAALAAFAFRAAAGEAAAYGRGLLRAQPLRLQRAGRAMRRTARAHRGWQDCAIVDTAAWASGQGRGSRGWRKGRGRIGPASSGDPSEPSSASPQQGPAFRWFSASLRHCRRAWGSILPGDVFEPLPREPLRACGGQHSADAPRFAWMTNSTAQRERGWNVRSFRLRRRRSISG